METAGVRAEATGTAASGAATEKARTIAATVRVRISVSFTKNPSQRETRGRDGGHRAHATWALDLGADSGVAAASAPSSRGSKSSTWMSSMTLRSYSRNAAASVSDTIPAASACRSEEHTSELQSHSDLVCRLLLEKKKNSRVQPTQLIHSNKIQITHYHHHR